jgi:lysophospholipase L1-like esterase
VEEIAPRVRVAGALALVGALTLTACGSSSDSATSASVLLTPIPTVAHKAGKGASVVAFGDSVPAGGGGCECGNFVQDYADLITDRTGKTSTVDNFAVGGTTSSDVVDLLATTEAQAAIKSATIVLIMTGANDYDDAFDEASIGIDPSQVYPAVATVVQDNVTNAIGKIKKLNSKAHVVVLDYWAAEEDGAVARSEYDSTTMAASIACTDSVNNALSLAAKASSAKYVSTLTAFKGPSGTNDDTNLLGADGDHPDATGHQVIARAIYAVYPKG